MKYVQFKALSTGYIEGTIPPQFSESNRKPIDLLGSDGVARLDSRKSVSSLIEDVIKIYKKHISKSSIVGFEIISSPENSYCSKYNRVLYTCTKLKEISL
jgi:hypothetical protein